MAERLVVAGAGMVPFMAAGSHASGMAERAIRNALDDAGVDVELIDQAVASHVHGDSASGEHALARAGLTGIAISNVSNGCASGSVALFHARQALLSGEARCVLAVGFEETRESPTDAAQRVPSCSARLDWLGRAHGNRRRDVRARCREGSRARGTQSVCCPSRAAVARRRAGDAASHRPPSPIVRERRELRRCCGRPLHAALRGAAWIARRRAARRACARERRSRQCGLARRRRRARLQHDASRGGTSLRERGRRSRGHRRCRSSRLLRRRRTDFLRGARPLRAGRHRAVRPLRREHLRRLGRRLAVRRDCFRWAMHRARRASRKSASLPGSFVAKRARARLAAHASPCSTTAHRAAAVAVAILRRKDYETPPL